LIPYAKPDKNITVEDVRRDLNMAENIDEDYENVRFFGYNFLANIYEKHLRTIITHAEYNFWV
jgi:hypothetical protein